MFDAVSAKNAMIKQINSRSTEMIEKWKQTARASRAEILGNRQRVMDQINFETIKLTPCKPTDSENTIEAKYNLCMQEIKEKSGSQTIEAWKNKAVESRRLIFATKHNVIAEIKTNENLKINLKSTKVISREHLMADLRTKCEPVPEWKIKQMKQKCDAINNKNIVNCEIRENEFILNSRDTVVEKFNKVLDQIREPTEAWKLKIRTQISNPHKNMKACLCDIAERNFFLESTKDAREQLMDSIRKNPVESWKLAKAKEFAKINRIRKSLLCDITEKKFTLKKIANREALLADIRSAYNIPESWTFCEAWKEESRNAKSKILLAHKQCMVSVEQGEFHLKNTKNSTRKEQLKACLDELRIEPIPAWKKAVQESRIATFENKNSVLSEITVFDRKMLKTVVRPVIENKLAVLEQLKAKLFKKGWYNLCIEGWKQDQMNKKACSFFNKHLMIEEMRTLKPTLKQTRSIEQTKTCLMAAIRAKINVSPVPEWQENERIERSKVQNARNLVLSELRSAKSCLTETKSLEQVRMQICREIRANQPIEAWKEKERESQVELYNNKRMVIQAIGNGNSCIGNKRSQAELKNSLMAEIRSKGDLVVPEWKEKRMQVRAEVLKNKVALNAAICNRKTVC